MKVILVLFVACVALATVCAQGNSTSEATTVTTGKTTGTATTGKTTGTATTAKTTAKTTAATTAKTTAKTTAATTAKTTAKTTAATTAKTTAATTAKTTAATTAKTTPATTPNPNVGHFKVTDGGKVCIILDSAIEIKFEYEKQDKKKEVSKPFNVPTNAKTVGTCSNTSAEMILEYDKDKIHFKFDDTDKKASLQTELFVFMDEHRFPQAKEANKTVNITSEKLNLGNPDEFFLCKSGETLKFLESKTTVKLTHFQVQAFNVDNGKFAANGTECPQDNPTTPTPSPTPTPKPTPPNVNNYTVDNSFGNVTCIFMRAGIQLQIAYLANNTKNSSIAINVPKGNETTVKGDCDLSNTSQELTVAFFQGWNVTFVFGKESDSSMLSADSSFKYELKTLTVHYNITKEHFPDAKEEGKIHTVEVVNLTGFFEANSDGSFLCKSDTNVTLEDGVFLTTSNLQYKAFNTDNSTDFKGDVNECPADSDTNSIVPIAVGAALAGLVVIVLIAYLIGRRRSRRSGYESV